MQLFNKGKKNLMESNNTVSDIKLLDQIGAMYVKLDSNNLVVDVNENTCHVLGYPRSEIINENWFKKFVPISNEEDYPENPMDDSYEKYVLTKSGEKRLVSWKRTCVQYGSTSHLVCIGEDITTHDNYLLTLHKIASTLLNGKDSIPYQSFVQLVGEAANANHTYIFVNNNTGIGEVRITKICEYGNGSFIYNEKEKTVLQDLALSIFDEGSVKKLLTGKIINLRTSSFPEDTQIFFKSFKIKAILLIPIMVDGDFFGFIGFDNRVNDREWTNSEIEFLKTSVKTLEQKIHNFRADEALRNENARFQTTMDAVEVIILVSDFDTNKIIYGNSFAYRKLGLIIDKCTEEVLDADNELPNEIYDRSNLIKNEKPCDVKEFVLVSEKEGRYYSCQIKAIKWTNGEWVRLETITDITEKKIAENKVKESEAKFKKLSAISVEGIMIHDQGVIVETNQALLDLMGYTYEEVIGKNIIPLAVHSSSHSTVENMMSISNPKPYEIIGVKKSGEKIPLELYAHKVVYEGEELRVAAIRDITQQKEAEKELIRQKNIAEESNKLKTQFLNNLSHEIRTPLNGIVGFTQFLTDPTISEEKLKNFVSIIQNSSYQLVRIIDDIIEISKLETKQVKPHIAEVNLNSVLLEMFSIFELKAVEKGVALRLNKGLSDSESEIFTDKSKLLKVLNNLVENALKFTHDGKVEIGYKRQHKELQLWVKDTGIGIDAGKQELIFDRFSQASKNTSKDYGGLGLGLSIAKENVQLLGGELTVESNLNEGALFVFTIPYKPVFEELEPKETTNKIRDTKIDFTVLIAEDEEVNFIFLEFLLLNMQSNIKIIHAHNGIEAVEFFENGGSCDLVFMDLKMPKLDGISATKSIAPKKPEVPIIALTAYSSAEDQKLAMEAGCVGFMTKPITVEVFKETCQEYLPNVKI